MGLLARRMEGESTVGGGVLLLRMFLDTHVRVSQLGFVGYMGCHCRNVHKDALATLG